MKKEGEEEEEGEKRMQESLMRRLKEKRLKEWKYTSKEREEYNRAISMRSEGMLRELKCYCFRGGMFSRGWVAGKMCPRCQMIDLRKKMDEKFPKFVEKANRRKESLEKAS